MTLNDKKPNTLSYFFVKIIVFHIILHITLVCGSSFISMILYIFISNCIVNNICINFILFWHKTTLNLSIFFILSATLTCTGISWTYVSKKYNTKFWLKNSVDKLDLLTPQDLKWTLWSLSIRGTMAPGVIYATLAFWLLLPPCNLIYIIWFRCS